MSVIEFDFEDRDEYYELSRELRMELTDLRELSGYI